MAQTRTALYGLDSGVTSLAHLPPLPRNPHINHLVPSILYNIDPRVSSADQTRVLRDDTNHVPDFELSGLLARFTNLVPSRSMGQSPVLLTDPPKVPGSSMRRRDNVTVPCQWARVLRYRQRTCVTHCFLAVWVQRNNSSDNG